MKKFSVCLLLIFISYSAYSQDLWNEIRQYKILPNSDTVNIDRTPSDWSFGAFGGGNYNVSFGNLKIGSSDVKKSFTGGAGLGYFIGFLAEWQRPYEKWGASLQLKLFDRRTADPETGDFLDKIESQPIYYSAKTVYDYLSISPLARYNLNYNGLFLTGGVDFDLNYGALTKYKKFRDSISDIQEVYRKIDVKPNSVRYGAQIGIACDLPTADMYYKIRARMTPFASIHIGSNVFSKNSSNWNAITVNFGLQVKFSWDDRTLDTLKYDTNQKAKLVAPKEIAESRNKINFPGFKTQHFEGAQLSAYIRQQIAPQEAAIAEALPQVQAETEEAIAAPKVEAPKPGKYKLNQAVKLVYKDNINSKIQKKDQTNLDQLAAFIEDQASKGKNLEIRIDGHVDQIGGEEQKRKVSAERANAVKNYLIKKGVKATIYATGRADFNPDPTVKSLQESWKNNRVEIIVVEKRK